LLLSYSTFSQHRRLCGIDSHDNTMNSE